MGGPSRGHAEPLRVGSVIRDRWRIDRRVGQGAMSVVWAATHRNGDRVAIKVLKPEFAREELARVRFLREAYVANRVGHPGVVRVIDDDVAPDGAPLLVMDLLEGSTLEQLRIARGGRLPVDVVVRRLAELLAILGAAHEKGIVHRDIKPANLFVDASDRLRVLDFGIARLFESAPETATATGSLLGTPEFMAPEQAAGRVREVDPRTDLYGVGATGFMLLSGQPVHVGASVPEVLNAVLGRPARPLAEVAPDVPLSIAAVIDRALRRAPEARWLDAGAMREALAAAAPGLLHAEGEEIAPAVAAPSSDAALDDQVTEEMLAAPGSSRPPEEEATVEVLATTKRIAAARGLPDDETVERPAVARPSGAAARRTAPLAVAKDATVPMGAPPVALPPWAEPRPRAQGLVQSPPRAAPRGLSLRLAVVGVIVACVLASALLFALR